MWAAEVRYGSDRVVVQLQPRYPLFGGWSTSFVFGWSLPLQDVVGKVRLCSSPFACVLGGTGRKRMSAPGVGTP
jgi:hypothetical protein